VGLLNSTPYWDELLTQAGVSAKKITVNDPLLHTYPVIIINSTKDDQKNIINSYLSNGGSVIAEAVTAKDTFNIPYKRKKVNFIYSQAEEVFNEPVFCEIDSVVKIPAGANYLRCNDDIKILLIKHVQQGTLVVFPDDFLNLIFSRKTRRKIFFSGNGSELPTEKVSRVDKNSIYNIVYRILEFLFHKKNLPFTRLWQFPASNETIFGFRVDTDFAEDTDIKNLYNSFRENEIKATWFVEVFSRKHNFEIFNQFRNQEIALHCYRHKTYKDKKNNYDDINHGLKYLNHAGYSPAGYAAPFGIWNESLGEAIENFEFIYSSEFGYIYDSLPVHSLIGGNRAKCLQIPIHPVSVGRLNIAGHNDKGMLKYYSGIIEIKKNAYEPIIFYTHPSQKRLDVFNNIFKVINELNISSFTFKDYAVWWKKRESVSWNPELKEDKILANTEEKDQSIWIHSSFKNRKNILSPINAQGLFSGKEIAQRKSDLQPGFNINLLKKNSFKILKQELIYNYRKLKH
jgi:hypothetical protein